MPKKSLKALAQWHFCPCANAAVVAVDSGGMTQSRVADALAVALAAPWLWVATAHAEGFAQLDKVPVVASPTCPGSVSAEAQMTPVQVDGRVEDGVRVAIHYDAGIYDGSCALTVTAAWVNLDTGASGSSDITAVSTIDGHTVSSVTPIPRSKRVAARWSSRSVRTRMPNCGSRREICGGLARLRSKYVGNVAA